MSTRAVLLAAVAAAVLAAVVSALLVPVVRRVALARGVVARPHELRWSSSPTPYLGGIAIWIGTIVGATAGIGTQVSRWPGQVLALVVASLFVVGIGLIDDLRPASIGARLAVEAGAALLLHASGIGVSLVGGALDGVGTVLLVIVVVNACNYLDNMDGALGLVAVGLAASISVLGVLAGQYLVAGAAAAVAGSCVGFLVHNWHPASIFMGDAGSLFLGFLLCALALKLETPVPGPVDFVGVVVTFAVPLFDMGLVYSSRWRAGRPLHVGGVDHTSHRLVGAGWTAPTVSLSLAAAALLAGVLGGLVRRDVVGPAPALAVVAVTGVVGAAALIRRPVGDPLSAGEPS